MFVLCNFVNVIDSRKTIQLNDIVANFYRHSTVCGGGGNRTLGSKALNVLLDWKKRSVDVVANLLLDSHTVTINLNLFYLITQNIKMWF